MAVPLQRSSTKYFPGSDNKLHLLAKFGATGEFVHLHNYFVVERGTSHELFLEFFLLAQEDGCV